MFYAPSSGGVRRYLLEKSAWLRRARPAVRHTVIVPGAADGSAGRGFSFLRAPALPGSGGYRLPLRLSAWADRLVAEQPDLIEAGDPYVPGFAARAAGRRLGVPVVGFYHSDLAALAEDRLGPWSRPMAQALRARLCDGFDLLIAPSRAAAKTLTIAGFDRVAVAPLGVDLDLFRPRPKARERLRRAIDLAPGERLLVFAGRPSPEKRIPILVETVRRLGPQFRLVLVGCGDGVVADRQVMVQPFEPRPDRLALWLGAADALIHANPNETLGLIALEAMACGVPVIGVASGGIGEVVGPSVGELAQTSTPAGLAAATRRLMDRDPVRVGVAARAHVAEQYSWPAAFERLMEIYHRLTGLDVFRRPA